MSLILNQLHSASDGIIEAADNDRAGSLLRGKYEAEEKYDVGISSAIDLMVIISREIS